MSRVEESPFKDKRGLPRTCDALRHSLQGFAAALRHEAAFRLEALTAAVMIPLALWLDLGAAAQAMLVASVVLVLIVELLNTAIETAVDRVSLAPHPLAKRAKDIGSAAACLSLLNAALVWAVILWDRYL